MAVTDIRSSGSVIRREESSFNTSDIQGVYAGRTVTVKDKGDKNDSWFGGFGQQDSEPDDQSTPPEKRKAQSRSEVRKSEQRQRAMLSESLPDFSSESDMQGFMLLLRRMMRDRDYSSLRDEAERLFPDVALRHGAIVAAAGSMKDNTGGDPDLQQQLETYARELEHSAASSIKAGYNISRRADTEAGGQPDLRQRLRDFYRDAIFFERNPAELYSFILDRFPDEALKLPTA